MTRKKTTNEWECIGSGPRSLAKKRKVYISGQISGLPMDKVDVAFSAAARELSRKYEDAIVVNPLDVSKQNEGLEWIEYMVKSIEILTKCDTIYMLRGWEASNGARIEYAIAEALSMEIIFQQKYALISTCEEQIRLTREAGGNVSKLWGNWKQMCEQRLAMEAYVDASQLRGNWRQMREQRWAMEDGLDASQLQGDHRQMKEQRIKMLLEIDKQNKRKEQ